MVTQSSENATPPSGKHYVWFECPMCAWRLYINVTHSLDPRQLEAYLKAIQGHLHAEHSGAEAVM